MEDQQVTHTYLNTQYRIVFEQAAVKGVLGFKVEANGDDLLLVKINALEMLEYAKTHAPAPAVEAK